MQRVKAGDVVSTYAGVHDASMRHGLPTRADRTIGVMEESRSLVQGSDGGRPVPRRTREVVIASIALWFIGVLGLLVTWLLLSVLTDATDHGQSVSSV